MDPNMEPTVVPPGALPNEVADDVDIKASEGEYVLPANVVRFLGLDKIEKMVAKAKEQIAELDAKGRIGGDTGEEELPFDPAELVSVDEGEEAPAFAEGGLVETAGTPQEQGFTGVKTFKGKDGKVVFIPYMNGAPLFAVPQGFTEDTPANPTSPVPSAAPMRQVEDPTPKSDSRALPGSPLAGDPNKWTVEDFINYGKQNDGPEEKMVKTIGAFVPGMGLAMGLRERMLDNTTPKLYDQMLETGKDLQGNVLTTEQIKSLSSTRDSLKEGLSKESGLDFTPLKTLTEAADRFKQFVGGGKNKDTGTNSYKTNPSLDYSNSMSKGSDASGKPYAHSGTSDSQGRPLTSSGPVGRPKAAPSVSQDPSGRQRSSSSRSGTPSGGYKYGGFVSKRSKKK